MGMGRTPWSVMQMAATRELKRVRARAWGGETSRAFWLRLKYHNKEHYERAVEENKKLGIFPYRRDKTQTLLHKVKRSRKPVTLAGPK